jgi:hypothetical protein
MIRAGFFLFLFSAFSFGTRAQQIFSSNTYPLVDFRGYCAPCIGRIIR